MDYALIGERHVHVGDEPAAVASLGVGYAVAVAAVAAEACCCCCSFDIPSCGPL